MGNIKSKSAEKSRTTEETDTMGHGSICSTPRRYAIMAMLARLKVV